MQRKQETPIPTLIEKREQKRKEIDAAIEQLKRKQQIKNNFYDGQEELRHALVNGQPEVAIALIQEPFVRVRGSAAINIIEIRDKKGNRKNIFVVPNETNEDCYKDSLLSIAVLTSNRWVVQTMLNAKADIEVKNPSDGFTPLLTAIEYGCHPSIVQCLLHARADINASINHETVFSIAQRKHQEIQKGQYRWSFYQRNFELLCHHRAKQEEVKQALANVNAKRKSDLTYNPIEALNQAIEDGQPEVVIALLREGNVHIDRNSFHSRSPLYLALTAKVVRGSIVQALLDAKAYVEEAVLSPLERFLAKTPPPLKKLEEGFIETPLELAIQRELYSEKRYGVIHRLLDTERIKLNANNSKGETPLFLAFAKNQTSIMECLIRNHANVNAVASDGSTLLSRAVQSGNVSMVKRLLEWKAKTDVNIVCKDEKSNLKATQEIDTSAKIAKASVSTIRASMDRVVYDVFAMAEKRKAEAISQKEESDYSQILQLLDEHNKKTRQAIIHLLKSLPNEAPHLIVESKHGKTKIYYNKYNISPEEERASHALAKIYDLSPNEVTWYSIVVNITRCLSRRVEKYEGDYWWVATDVPVNSITTMCEPNLYAAARTGDEEMVRFLIAAGADVHVISSLVKLPTPLYVAVDKGHYHLIKWLLMAGAGANIDVPVPPAKKTPLEMASFRGRESIVELLLKTATQSCANSFYAAAASGDGRLIQLMIEAKSNVYHPTPDHNPNPLFIAAGRGHEGVVAPLVEWLMKTFPIPTQRREMDVALYYAVKGGHFNTVTYLIGKGANVNQRRERSNLLCIATERCHSKIVKLLINAQANPHYALDHLTPLAIAKNLKNHPTTERDFSEIIQMLSRAEESFPAISDIEQRLIHFFDVRFDNLLHAFIKTKTAANRPLFPPNEPASDKASHTVDTTKEDKPRQPFVDQLLEEMTMQLKPHAIRGLFAQDQGDENTVEVLLQAKTNRIETYPAFAKDKQKTLSSLTLFAKNRKNPSKIDQGSKAPASETVTLLEKGTEYLLTKSQEDEKDNKKEPILKGETVTLLEKGAEYLLTKSQEDEKNNKKEPIFKRETVTLLEKGAEYLLTKSQEDEKDNEKEPIFKAAEYGCMQNVETWLKMGDFPLYLDMNATVVSTALKKGYPKIADMLIHYKANIDGGPLNENPLYIAAEKGYTEIVTLLLDAGANPHADQWGFIGENRQTPQAIAKEKGYQKIANQLAFAEHVFPLQNKSSLDEQVLWGLIQLSFGELQRIRKAMEEITPKMTEADIKQSVKTVYRDTLRWIESVTPVAQALKQLASHVPPIRQSSASKQDKRKRKLLAPRSTVKVKREKRENPIASSDHDKNRPSHFKLTR